jgi:multiple sugar transport system permease protein
MTKQKKIIYALVYHIVVIGLGFIIIYPVIWMVMGSFKNNAQILNDSSKLLPESFDLKNYITGWKGFGRTSFTTFFRNSIFLSVCSTFGVMFSSALVAYSFARIRFKMRKILFACMISTMMLPGQVVMIPQYIIFQKLGLVNTYVPLILPAYFGSAFFIFMMMQFIAGIPKELDDAATIDGCSRYSIFSRIILSLISPALITTVIISFYQSWDNFMGPLIYLSRPEKYPVALAIKMFADSSSVTDYGAMFAMSTLSLVPVFLIFLFFNKYIMEGISTQGLKM